MLVSLYPNVSNPENVSVPIRVSQVPINIGRMGGVTLRMEALLVRIAVNGKFDAVR